MNDELGLEVDIPIVGLACKEPEAGGHHLVIEPLEKPKFDRYKGDISLIDTKGI